jgi:hypothetical protein
MTTKTIPAKTTSKKTNPRRSQTPGLKARPKTDAVSPLPPTESQTPPPFSSARSLLKHAGKWVGDDLEERLREVYATRSQIEF